MERKINPSGKRLVVGPLIQDVFYRIRYIDSVDFATSIYKDKLPPQVGEKIVVHYDYSNATIGGYEKLSFLIPRLTPEGWVSNYVRYFSSIEEMEDCIHGVFFDLDKQFARDRIAEKEKEIQKYRDDYCLDSPIE
jgi:hypothetical protein